MREYWNNLITSTKQIINDRRLLIPTLLSSYGAYQLGISLKNPDWFEIVVFGIFCIYFVIELVRGKGDARRIAYIKIFFIVLVDLFLFWHFGASLQALAAILVFSALAILVEFFDLYLKENVFSNSTDDKKSGWLSSEIAALSFILGVLVS